MDYGLCISGPTILSYCNTFNINSGATGWGGEREISSGTYPRGENGAERETGPKARRAAKAMLRRLGRATNHLSLAVSSAGQSG